MSKIQNLINAVINEKEIIPYINLDKNNKYLGWVYDFNLNLPNGEKMSLDLKKEHDLFLLFILASAWSRSGYWEDAAYFVTYIKSFSKGYKNYKEYWQNDKNIDNEIKNRKENAVKVSNICKGILQRKTVSFRKDFYLSIKVLASNWDEILYNLKKSEIDNNFLIFIKYIRSIKGLGMRNNRMNIKIPLILRELRCQKIYNNILGEYCCVPDERVNDAVKDIGIEIIKKNSKKIIDDYSLNKTLKASKFIYDNFGDLYDIPLFAYEDLKKYNI